MKYNKNLLINRSPGFTKGIGCTDWFEWPNASLVPILSQYQENDEIVDWSYIQQLQNSKNQKDAVFLKRFNQEITKEQAQLELYRKHGPSYGNINVENIALNGFSIFNLDKSDIDYLYQQFRPDIKRLNTDKPDRSFRHYDRSASYRRKLGSKHIKMCDTVEKIFARVKALKLASQYFNKKMKVYSVTLHISKPDDVHYRQVLSDINYVPQTVNMHFDPKAGVMKAILYLKTIDETDGPFTYIPKSHRWATNPLERIAAKANSTTNYLDSEDQREWFMSLPSNLRKTSIFGSITDNSDPLSLKLIKAEQRFLSSDGNMIMFDPGMIHRGGLCTSGTRISLQIAMR